MQKKYLVLAVAGALMMGSTAFAADKAAAEKAIADAKAMTKEANSAGGEWRDTGKIIKKAEAAAKDGDYDKAVKLADTAKFQSETGLAQAESQKGVGNPGFLKY